jgi:hypothetical protein
MRSNRVPQVFSSCSLVLPAKLLWVRIPSAGHGLRRNSNRIPMSPLHPSFRGRPIGKRCISKLSFTVLSEAEARFKPRLRFGLLACAGRWSPKTVFEGVPAKEDFSLAGVPISSRSAIRRRPVADYGKAPHRPPVRRLFSQLEGSVRVALSPPISLLANSRLPPNWVAMSRTMPRPWP